MTRGPFPLEVKYHNVNVSINELTAETEIDQVFYNPGKSQLEGTYIFPVPKGAVISDFRMEINGRLTKAELISADKARDIYEKIVREHLDPALLEYQGRDLFKIRIFPIEPHSQKRVKIIYREILQKDNGTIEYLYPLNTEKFSSSLLQEVSVTVRLNTRDNIKNIYCTSHETNIERLTEKSAKIEFKEKNTRPDRDFKLYFNTDKSRIGSSLLTYKISGEDGFFLLDISPGINDHNMEVTAKDITFVLDNSGSMAGKKMEQAKKSLLFCVANLNKNDRFNIIRFSTEAESLFDQLTEVNKQSTEHAGKFINKLSSIGGTNIEEALQLALSAKTSDSRPHIIVFITDGRPTIGETDEDRLLSRIKKHNNSNTRIFTFGIGYEINIHLLDKITMQTRATRSYIAPDEDIEVKISNFYMKIKSPVLTDITLQTTGNVKLSKLYPLNLPDLFHGSSLAIAGRYKGSGASTLVVKGKMNGKLAVLEYKLDFPAQKLENTEIAALWAARRVGYLLDQIRLNGEDKELVDETAALAREYGIITPYTSYLIVEDEIQRSAGNNLDTQFQTLNNIFESEKKLMSRAKNEYDQLQDKSGQYSVEASEEIQELNNAYNFSQTAKTDDNLNYTDTQGRQQNLNAQVKSLNGRAFYYSGNYWIDSKIQDQNYKKIIRIKFAGRDYFDFLRKNPGAAVYLSAGTNIRFYYNGNVYEIHK